MKYLLLILLIIGLFICIKIKHFEIFQNRDTVIHHNLNVDERDYEFAEFKCIDYEDILLN